MTALFSLLVNEIVLLKIKNVEMVNEGINVLVVEVLENLHSAYKIEFKLDLLLLSFLEDLLVVILRQHHEVGVGLSKYTG